MPALAFNTHLKRFAGHALLSSGVLRPALRRHKAIFMLHRVCAGPVPRWQETLAVQQQDFEAWLCWLHRHFTLVDLMTCLEDPLPRPAGQKPLASLTFDDGWADNLSLAMPVLEKHRIPASIFLATGFIGTQRRFWWETLSDTVWNPTPEAMQALREAARARDLPRPPDLQGPAQARWLQLHAWLEALKAHPTHEREALANAVPGSRVHALRIEDVQRMEASGLIRFGPHSVSHALLDQLDDAHLDAEIRDSMTQVHDWCTHPLPVFCYPNGSEDARVRLAVARAGIPWGLATGGQLVSTGSDPLAVPRINITASVAAQPGLLGYRLLKALRASRSASA